MWKFEKSNVCLRRRRGVLSLKNQVDRFNPFSICKLCICLFLARFRVVDREMYMQMQNSGKYNSLKRLKCDIFKYSSQRQNNILFLLIDKEENLPPSYSLHIIPFLKSIEKITFYTCVYNGNYVFYIIMQVPVMCLHFY